GGIGRVRRADPAGARHSHDRAGDGRRGEAALLERAARATAAAPRHRVMRIAILLPMVWSVRNVVHAGVLHALAEAGVETHLLVWQQDPRATSEIDPLGDAAGVHPLLDVAGRLPRAKAFVDATLTSAFQRQHRIHSYDIYRRWFSRHDGPLARARGAMVE